MIFMSGIFQQINAAELYSNYCYHWQMRRCNQFEV